MQGMIRDQRRAMIERANTRGFVVRGKNGETLPGRLSGYSMDFPTVHVAHPFGPVQFEISWQLAKKIADGHAPIVGAS